MQVIDDFMTETIQEAIIKRVGDPNESALAVSPTGGLGIKALPDATVEHEAIHEKLKELQLGGPKNNADEEILRNIERG